MIDAIIPEPEGSAAADPQTAVASLKPYLLRALTTLETLTADELLAQRSTRYRRF
jgi:acetyl-CoA carboxylase alpha subunit